MPERCDGGAPVVAAVDKPESPAFPTVFAFLALKGLGASRHKSEGVGMIIALSLSLTLSLSTCIGSSRGHEKTPLIAFRPLSAERAGSHVAVPVGPFGALGYGVLFSLCRVDRACHEVAACGCAHLAFRVCPALPIRNRETTVTAVSDPKIGLIILRTVQGIFAVPKEQATGSFGTALFSGRCRRAPLPALKRKPAR
jgi:hypothetical protein